MTTPTLTWWERLRVVLGRNASVDDLVENHCRFVFPSWEPRQVGSRHLPGFSDEDKDYWRALYRPLIEQKIEDGEL